MPLSPNPNRPVMPRPTVESGLAAAEAGASIIHVHVRDAETGKYSGVLERVRSLVETLGPSLASPAEARRSLGVA
ncbi:3-keto-5-aminohexanoate cleavage protein [Burkholderia sp. MR1-5-21]